MHLVMKMVKIVRSRLVEKSTLVVLTALGNREASSKWLGEKCLGRREHSLSNRVSRTSKVVVMKGVSSSLCKVQHLRLLDHYAFPQVVGSYGFVPNPRIIGFSIILPLTHQNLALEFALLIITKPRKNT